MSFVSGEVPLRRLLRIVIGTIEPPYVATCSRVSLEIGSLYDKICMLFGYHILAISSFLVHFEGYVVVAAGLDGKGVGFLIIAEGRLRSPLVVSAHIVFRVKRVRPLGPTCYRATHYDCTCCQKSCFSHVFDVLFVYSAW